MLLLYALVISTVAIWIWHLLYSKFQRMMLRKDPPVFPTLIVGVTRESRELIAKLNKGLNPLKPVAVLDGKGCKDSEIDGVPVRGKLNKLEDVLGEGITHLIQCSDLEQSLNLLSACRQKKITYMLLPSVLGIVERDEKVESLEGQPVTMVGPKENALMWFFK
jgi:FlaA1/EpsC-like NDP-sugar epimerase